MCTPRLGQTDSDIEQSDKGIGQHFGGIATRRDIGVGPGHHALGQVRRLIALFFGKAKHVVNRPHRQAFGHLLDEITLLRLDQIIDDRFRLVLDLGLDLGDLSRREDRATSLRRLECFAPSMPRKDRAASKSLRTASSLRPCPEQKISGFLLT